MTVLRVVFAGLGVTLQDGARHSFRRFGVSPAGPMDPLAFATAQLAVGASPNATAIEVSLGGLELLNEGVPLTIAVAGGRFGIRLDDRDLPAAARARLDRGSVLRIKPGSAGAWCYVAVCGQVAIAASLGSTSTHMRSGLGGLNGRALRAGDLLPVADAHVLDSAIVALDAPWLREQSDVIRVMLGPQDDYFSSEQIATFLAGPWTISPRSDRMAYRLDGPRIGHAGGFNIVSDGITTGAIQIPGDGHPLVLMADHQPTGGYPKIATVITSDLGRLAQMGPGGHPRFVVTSLADAVHARRDDAAMLKALAFRPLLSSEFLLSVNLVDGVSNGLEPPAEEAAKHAALQANGWPP